MSDEHPEGEHPEGEQPDAAQPDAEPPSAGPPSAEAAGDAACPDAALDAHSRLERRAFLRGAAAVAGVAGAAGWASMAPPSWPLSLKDPTGELGKPRHVPLRLPEGGYAVEVAAGTPDLGIARGVDPEGLVRTAFDLVGGVGRYIDKGDVVLVKPNVAFERAPALGATSNPEVVAAVIKVVFEAGASEVRVADNPIEAPESCFIRSGVHKACVDAGARVYIPSPGDFQLLATPGATYIEAWPFFYRPFLGVDKVIGVAPVKDHNLCRASMTTKNWYGLLGGRRNQFHQDIHGIINDLALMMRPTLVLLDATRIMFRSGPTGGSLSDVKEGRTVVAARDSLAVDAFGWHDLLERQSETIPAYLTKAEARGLGQTNWKGLVIKEERVG